MSALPPKADIGTQSQNVRFVPKADIGTFAWARIVNVDVQINEPCRARPMPAESNEWCRQHLSEDWHVMRSRNATRPSSERDISSPELVPDRQERVSSNRQCP